MEELTTQLGIFSAGGRLLSSDPRTSFIKRGSNSLHQLLLNGREYNATKHQVVQSSDDRYRSLINLVKKGYIKRYEVTNDGSISIQAIYGPGDIFPLTQVYKTIFGQDLYEGPEIIYYEAMEECKILSIDVASLSSAISEDHTIYSDLLVEMGTKMNSSIQRLENLSLKNSLKRTAHQLLYFARKFGKEVGQGVSIELPLTHQDIADVLSLTRETISINMRRLQKKGLVASGHNIVVSDLTALEVLAYK